MILGNVIRVALRSMLLNKMRLFLTMLGIIIGVGAIIGMLAVGDGAREAALRHFKELGSNLLVVYNHWGHSRRQQISIDEWHALSNMTEYVQMTAPEVMRTTRGRHGNENMELSILGTTPEYFPIRNTEVEVGRPFTQREVREMADVCVIGSQVAEDLFLGQDPIHQNIYIEGRRLRVIGVTKARGTGGWYNPDTMVLAPLTSVMGRIVGQEHLNSVHITCNSFEIIEEARAALTHELRQMRGLTDDEEDNFRFFSNTEVMDQIEEHLAIFRALMAGIAGLSLLVGGIGIMNIMLVTVTERTREIGIRKALGAKRRDIMVQFLIESIVICVIGGGVGIAVGYGMASGFGMLFPDFDALVTPQAIVLAVTCSTILGLLFGIYPARRAAKLDPIEALRDE